MAGQKSNTIVLVSGGLDSAVCLSIAFHKEQRDIYPVSFFYGQRHAKECFHADAVVQHFRNQSPRVKALEFIRIKNLFDQLVSSSSLTDSTKKIPDHFPYQDNNTIPSTFVPGRNIIFLACMAAYAEEIEAGKIYIGVNALDYSGYPDCRPAFIKAMQEAISFGTTFPKFLITPLLALTKAEIVKEGLKYNAPIKYTWSCYRGGAVPCGTCDSCKLRAKGFEAAGIKDPALEEINND